jgi:uncharacterized protein with ParB-like and HNH nuclease domain
MSDEGTPLFVNKAFAYPGDPDAGGKMNIFAGDWKQNYTEFEFQNSSDFIRALDNDITLTDVSLLEVIDGNQFSIPPFQRNYSWHSNQQEDMWETLRQVAELETQANEKPSDTYFGSIYIAQHDRTDEREIIDGQQRLATVAIILNNLTQSIGTHLGESSKEVGEYAKHVREDIIQDMLYESTWPDVEPFIVLNEHDHPIFKLLFLDDEDLAEQLEDIENADGRKKNVESRDEFLGKLGFDTPQIEKALADSNKEYIYVGDAHHKLLEANAFYKTQIREFLELHCENADQRLLALTNLTFYLLRSLRVSQTKFDSNNQQLAIQVFQSLNDRGVKLSNMDKIRARIVARFQGEDDRAAQVNRWSQIVKKFGQDSDAVESFLIQYLAATEKEFETASDAGDKLLEAFRLTQRKSDDIRSRLGATEARDTLVEIEEYAEMYLEIQNASLTVTNYLEKDTARRAEAIIERLQSLGTKIWEPFVLVLYKATLETPGSDQDFLEVMQTVENMMCRFVISPHSASVIETTFPIGANQLLAEIDQSGDFDSDSISEHLIHQVEQDATDSMFGKKLANELVSQTGWQNNQVKVFLWKLIDEELQSASKGLLEPELYQDSEVVHIEHVLPKSPILKANDEPLRWLEVFFEPEGRVSNKISTIASKIEASDNDSVYSGPIVSSILSDIEEKFSEDLGNMMLLTAGENISVGNKLFGEKLAKYHEIDKHNMENVANRYFSSEGPLSAEEIESVRTETENAKPEHRQTVLQELDEWWTWKKSKERKTQLVSKLVHSLTFDVREDEFEDVHDRIEKIVANDFDNRFALIE